MAVASARIKKVAHRIFCMRAERWRIACWWLMDALADSALRGSVLRLDVSLGPCLYLGMVGFFSQQRVEERFSGRLLAAAMGFDGNEYGIDLG